LLTVWAPDGRSRLAERVWSAKDLLRRANRRLSVLRHAEEVSGNVAATCRYYGISRNVFYRWKRRHEDEGIEGLKDRSSAPLHCPTVTQPEVVEKIIHLRQHYHFGPMKIAMYLKRYHDVEISASGVWRILKRLNMNRLPASQRYKRHTGRWKRYEKQRPGHHVQIDVKFIEPIITGSGRRKRYYQYTAIDDCTRLRVLRAYPRSDQKTAIQFLDYVLSRLPFQVEKIQTDNGAEFQSSFHWHVLDQGIGHIYIRPATPRLNGKVERSHRIDAEEFYRLLDGVIEDDTGLFNQKLKEWRTTTTTTGPTAGSAVKPPTNDCYKRPRPNLSPATVSPTTSRPTADYIKNFVLFPQGLSAQLHGPAAGLASETAHIPRTNCHAWPSCGVSRAQVPRE
jgi:transposase InsO family protein